MKKILSYVFVFLVLSLLAHAGSKALSQANSPQVTATLQSHSPDPVEPGQIVTVKFKIENKGKETTNDAVVRILPKYPFAVYNDRSEKNIGKLKALSTGADAVVVEFKLKVDEKAVEEDTELELEVQMGENAISYVSNEFMIDIETHDAVLDITSITSEPLRIAPGGTGKVNIQVKNLADSLLKDIKFKLDFNQDSLPLAPYQSSSERRISQLESKFQDSLSFQLIAEPDAVPGLYKVPMNITYNDEKGNSYSLKDLLAVVIGETPKVKAYIKKSTVLQANKAGKITLEIANGGTTDVKFVELYLLPSDDYELVSTTRYIYVGEIDSDDTDSEEIDIFVKRSLKELHFPVQLKYLDANNQPFQQAFDLELPLHSASELKKFGVLESNNTWVYVLLILFLSAGYFYYRKYYKAKKK